MNNGNGLIFIKFIESYEDWNKGAIQELLYDYGMSLIIDGVAKEITQEEYDSISLAKHNKQAKTKMDGEKKVREHEEKIMNERIKISLPKDGRLISEFAYELGQVVKHNKELFIKKETNKIVKIDLLGDGEENKRIGFNELNVLQFISYIEKHIDTGKWVNIAPPKEMPDFKFINKSMNKQISEIVLESDQFRNSLPHIKTIYTVPIPILYEGKLTFPKKGYDERFKSWLDYNSPEIKDGISFEEAKKIIYSLFEEFCFKEEIGRTHAIAGLLTPFLRGLYPNYYCRAPIFLYEANRERSGKDYCAGITGIVYEEEAREEPALSTDDNKKTATGDELRKKLLASLKQGRKRLHFANNRGFVANAILEGFATAKRWSDRLLGKNEELEFGNDIELSMSANLGLTYTSDLMYRMRKISLFLDLEDPNDRKFKKSDLHGYVRENRSEILGAMYVLIKDWVDNGMINGETPFSSFPEWAKICGGIMNNADFGNPCLPDKTEVIGGDTLTNDFKQMWELVYEKFPDVWLSKQELNILLEENKQEYEIFGYLELSSRSDQTSFGKSLSKMYGRIFNNIKLVVDTSNKRSARHKLKFTKEIIGNVGNVGNLIEVTPTNNKEEENKNLIRSENVTNVTNVTNILDNWKKNDDIKSLQELLDLGFSEGQIERLREDGTIFKPLNDGYKLL